MLEVYVSRKIVEAEGVCSFELSAVNGTALPDFSAGAHVDVHVAPGLTRQYSLCNSPEDSSKYLIAVLHDPESRGGSRGMHLDVQEGSKLTIGTPRNLFALDLSGDHYVLFAGGIGITPILAMAHTLVRNGKSFELHYCGRSIERLSFLGVLNDAPFAGHVHVHCDDGAPQQRLDAGFVLAAPTAGTQLYMCGPSGFMGFLQSTAKAQGWSDMQIHREDFTAAPASAEGNTAFQIELGHSGRVLEIPADKTVLEVLLEHDVAVESSCEQGICGTCITKVLAGKPDHRDQFMTDAERVRGDCFAPCCSRALSQRLVLDL